MTNSDQLSMEEITVFTHVTKSQPNDHMDRQVEEIAQVGFCWR